jgi:AraC-like DNA-binding protein
VEHVRLSTDSVVTSNRLPYWRDFVCDTFVELECDSVSGEQFFGSITNQTLGNIQFSDVDSCAQHVVRTRSKISQSGKDYFLLSLQTRGRGMLTQDGRTALLQPGDFALYDTTRPYDLRFDDEFGQLVLRLPRRTVTDQLADAERLTALRIAGDRGTGLLASTFIRQLHDSIDTIDLTSASRLHCSAIDLIATALADQAGRTPHTSESQYILRRRICAFIDAHLDDYRLDCAMIAAAHRISERYLRKIFATSTMSASQWLWSRRLQQARRDLLDPLRAHLSISAIGYDVGFKDCAHFSRAFKAKFGESPSACRANARLSGNVPLGTTSESPAIKP